MQCLHFVKFKYCNPCGTSSVSAVKELKMGDKGIKDKGKRAKQKKGKQSLKEKRKQKQKNK
jgi:hypothetical protein